MRGLSPVASHRIQVSRHTSQVTRLTSQVARLPHRVCNGLLITYDYYASVFHISVDMRAMLMDTESGRCRERDLVTPINERRMCCQVCSLLQEAGAN